MVKGKHVSYKLALSRYSKLQNRAATCSKKRKFEAKLLDKTPKFNDEAWLRQAITSKIRRLVMSKASGGIGGRRRSLSMESEHFDLEVEQVNSPQKDELASAVPEKVTEQDITTAQDDIDRVSTVVEDLKKKKSELFTKLKLALKEERTRQKIEAQEAAKRKKQHEVMAAAAETEAAAEQRKMASRPPPPPPPSAPPQQRDASQRDNSQRESSGPPKNGRISPPSSGSSPQSRRPPVHHPPPASSSSFPRPSLSGLRHERSLPQRASTAPAGPPSNNMMMDRRNNYSRAPPNDRDWDRRDAPYSRNAPPMRRSNSGGNFSPRSRMNNNGGRPPPQHHNRMGRGEWGGGDQRNHPRGPPRGPPNMMRRGSQQGRGPPPQAPRGPPRNNSQQQRYR